jgi:group I intron endonuclease
MASGIYKITNTTNGKVYVGSAVNFDTRWKEHARELRKGTHHSSALQNAWNKYGEENFEFSIIEECERTRKVLLGREQYWMDTLDSVAKGYNIAKTAGSQLGMKQSPEAIAARVEKNTGKKRTPETRALMSEVQSNRSPEWCANISASKKRYWAEKGTDSIKGENNPMYGKPRSPETLEKMSKSLKGKKRTPEQRAKMRETQSKRPQEVNDKIAESLRGGKRTPEQRAHFSEVQSNRSPEWRDNISSSKKETWAARGEDERTLIFVKASLAQGKRQSSSGFVGVYNRSGKWKIRLKINKENVKFPNFQTPEAANAARVKYLTDLKEELESKLANQSC